MYAIKFIIRLIGSTSKINVNISYEIFEFIWNQSVKRDSELEVFGLFEYNRVRSGRTSNQHTHTHFAQLAFMGGSLIYEHMHAFILIRKL